MKQIFNWVHQKFHKNLETCSDSETKVMDKSITHENVLSGILTIGTFGFNPLYQSNSDRQSEFIPNNEIDEHESEQERELQLLTVKSSCKHEFEEALGSNPVTNVSDQDHDSIKTTSTVDNTSLVDFLNTESSASSVEKLEIMDSKNNERTTLANLFSLPDHDSNFTMNLASSKESATFFIKKLIKGEDSRLFRTLHRLTTRILRKKIHPKLHGEIRHNGLMILRNKEQTDNSSTEKMQVVQQICEPEGCSNER